MMDRARVGVPSIHEIVFRTREFAYTLGEFARIASPPGRDSFSGSAVSRFVPRALVQSFAEPGRTLEVWKRLFPRSVERAIEEAEGILHGRITVFSDSVDVAGEPDWHRDYRTGARAPLAFGRWIDTLDRRIVGDAKNIWELNRTGYLLTLGKAFWATRERKYYERWKELILSWIEANPIDRGVNWNSSLELSIRIINWLWSSWFFAELFNEDTPFLEAFSLSILAQADRVARHLSCYFSPNTHLTGEALGLLYVGLAYPQANVAHSYVTRGRSILRSEFLKQILADGGYFERATWYHKYTLEFYLHELVLCGLEGGGINAEAFKRAIVHLALLSEPDGTIPILGDSDGGELLSLGGQKGNIRGICSATAVLFEDGELKELASEYREEALWLLGPDSRDRWKRIEGKKLRTCHSFNADTGWYALRTGMTVEDSFVIFDCGTHGWGRCGHAHSDMLSFLWYCCGRMVLEDPGSPVYGGDPLLRDRMRSSSSHNTVTLEGVSQSIPGALFSWKKIARPVEPGYEAQDGYGFLHGQHDGYDGIGCRHWRGILFVGTSGLLAADIVRCKKPALSFSGSLQFCEGRLERDTGVSFRFVPKGLDRILGIRFFGTLSIDACEEEGAISKDYNKLTPAPRVSWRVEGTRGDMLVFTVLCSDFADLASFSCSDQFSIFGTCGGKRLELRIEPGNDGSRGLRVCPKVVASIEEKGKRSVFSLDDVSGGHWRTEMTR